MTGQSALPVALWTRPPPVSGTLSRDRSAGPPGGTRRPLNRQRRTARRPAAANHCGTDAWPQHRAVDSPPVTRQPPGAWTRELVVFRPLPGYTPAKHDTPRPAPHDPAFRQTTTRFRALRRPKANPRARSPPQPRRTLNRLPRLPPQPSSERQRPGGRPDRSATFVPAPGWLVEPGEGVGPHPTLAPSASRFRDSGVTAVCRRVCD